MVSSHQRVYGQDVLGVDEQVELERHGVVLRGRTGRGAALRHHAARHGLAPLIPSGVGLTRATVLFGVAFHLDFLREKHLKNVHALPTMLELNSDGPTFRIN